MRNDLPLPIGCASRGAAAAAYGVPSKGYSAVLHAREVAGPRWREAASREVAVLRWEGGTTRAVAERRWGEVVPSSTHAGPSPVQAVPGVVLGVLLRGGAAVVPPGCWLWLLALLGLLSGALPGVLSVAWVLLHAAWL
jgi:hypothetical protein